MQNACFTFRLSQNPKKGNSNVDTKVGFTTTCNRRTISRNITRWVEPADVFAQIQNLPGAVLLESQPHAVGGRFSLLCFEPFGTLITHERRSTLTLSGAATTLDESPFDILRQVYRQFSLDPIGVPVFPSGAVGYLGYELNSFLERVPPTKPDDVGIPDCWLGLYNSVAVFDHHERRIGVYGYAFDGICEPLRNVLLLEELIYGARNELNVTEAPSKRPRYVASSHSKAEYCSAVKRVIDYIASGDIYQANISQRFSVSVEMSPWEMYLRLRACNPAPYAAFLNIGDAQIVSSSPECFLNYNPLDRRVLTRPIKGTRPRGHTPTDDDRLRHELVLSEKDCAENVMIVDLERNDLGRVCEYGSIHVPELFTVESHATVHHLVSTVTGRLRPECSPLDLLTACFPGGSITGAPKIRAMEIINEIEPVRRGVYTGSIGWLGFEGSVNLSIAIRTAVVKNGVCYFHVGGGIVADSNPEMEYSETLDKGRAFLEVLGCK